MLHIDHNMLVLACSWLPWFCCDIIYLFVEERRSPLGGMGSFGKIVCDYYIVKDCQNADIQGSQVKYVQGHFLTAACLTICIHCFISETIFKKEAHSVWCNSYFF